MNLLRRLRGELETPRLVLRRWREGDREDFLAFASDPEVMLSSGAPHRPHPGGAAHRL